MKKLIFLMLTVVFCYAQSFAKKVKFAVDMTGQTVSPNGVHISGDFQTLAGFSGGDWNSASCPMLQEGTTEIYSIVVEIPAFQKYEYRIINGDLFYESEFVPVESRVGYDFNDNRWIYVDSLINDTTYAGAVLFGGNAPEGKRLVRFYVDMSSTNVSQTGVHMAGTYNGWNFTKAPLYNFEGQIYEVIQYLPEGDFEYKFSNGYGISDAETVPTACATNSNRTITVVNDTLLDIVCFSSCSPCGTGIQVSDRNLFNIYPNPSNGLVNIELNGQNFNISVYDAKGSVCYNVENYKKSLLQIENLNTGFYFISIFNEINKEKSVFPFIVE